ncbi:MAG: type II toxin-antitoxin system HicB family antitoxin [Planctomycetes bacterium]|nr:type II toxin-antitoxin system HicB family antitoxin [Planctomycetota bacterium]
MEFWIETEREEDERWIAEILDVPGALAYGATESEAIERAKVLAIEAIREGGTFIDWERLSS